MLFLLFQLGRQRCALEAERVVEVVPLAAITPIPRAPKGVAGLFNYRGRPVPAVDLSELTLGRPSAERLSTRIMVVRCPDRRGTSRWLGLIAEHATEMVRKEPAEFVEAGGSRASEICLGPVLMDAQGSIQRIDERRLISESLLALLFPETAEAAGGEA